MKTRTDHPRSRGVYAKTMGNGKGKSGSSPLARGLRVAPGGGVAPPRIIPARAGFTAGSVVRMVNVPDHPRSRGVYHREYPTSRAHAGSSPLARGLLLPLSVIWESFRIIPARAGFTNTIITRQAYRKDHPRSRGVYPASEFVKAGGGGSSPLARGLRGLFLRVD